MAIARSPIVRATNLWTSLNMSLGRGPAGGGSAARALYRDSPCVKRQTDWHTHTTENITFPLFRWRAIIRSFDAQWTKIGLFISWSEKYVH